MRSYVPPLTLALFLCGCSGERDALRKDVEALRQEVGRMRAANNILAARVETLELTRTKVAAPAAAPPSREDDRPSLDVVHLAPEAKASAPGEIEVESADGEEDDREEPRPVLRSFGRGGVVAQTPASKVGKTALPVRAASTAKGASR